MLLSKGNFLQIGRGEIMTLNQNVIEDQETFSLISGELNIQGRFYLQWWRVAQWPRCPFWALGSWTATVARQLFCFSGANI